MESRSVDVVVIGADKRAGVPGGIQVTPPIAEQTAHLSVFQRTADCIVPESNILLCDATRAAQKDDYAERRRLGGVLIAKTFADWATSPP